MHYPDLPFSCPLNESLLAVIINRTVWQGQAPKQLLDHFKDKGAQYMGVSRNVEDYIVSFTKSHRFPLLSPEEEEQMVFILSLEN